MCIQSIIDYIWHTTLEFVLKYCQGRGVGVGPAGRRTNISVTATTTISAINKNSTIFMKSHYQILISDNYTKDEKKCVG